VSRVRTLFVTALPSAIIGGFLFGSAFGHAETGSGGALGFWPAASDSATGSVIVAQADPRPPRYRGPIPPPPPAPPAPPTAAPPPVPPAPPTVRVRGRHGRGLSLSIHDGKIEVDGIAELVTEQLENVSNLLDQLPDVPPDVRERLRGRIRGVRDKINARLGRLKSMDLDRLDRLGPEVEQLGDEIAKEMEGLDKDLAQLDRKFGRGFARGAGPSAPSAAPAIAHSSEDGDDDDDDDDDKDTVVVGPDTSDPASMAPAIAALDHLGLDPNQRAQLAKLRAESDRKIDGAKRELERLSGQLHEALLATSVNQADIERQIDSISTQEAAIRKARILTWIKARELLRKDQRKMVEAAVKSR
jgi:hypothetical protein